LAATTHSPLLAIIAISILLFVRIPHATVTAEGRAGQGTVLQEAVYGWKYIMARPGLAALMTLFSFTNFTTEMTVVLFTPLILSFASTAKLGLAMSLCSSGFLVGGLLMSIWGGPKRRVAVMMTLMILLGVFSAMIGLRPSVGLIVFSGFLVHHHHVAIAGLQPTALNDLWLVHRIIHRHA